MNIVLKGHKTLTLITVIAKLKQVPEMSVMWPRVSSEDQRTARYIPEVTDVAQLSCPSMQAPPGTIITTPHHLVISLGVSPLPTLF